MKNRRLHLESCARLAATLTLTLAFAANLALGQTSNAGQARPLEPNQPLEREMAKAEKHYYKFDLYTDEFLQVRVEQKGIDVALKLTDPTGVVVATMDAPNGSYGPEVLSFVARKAGRYTLEVSSLDVGAKRGTYIVTRADSRAATAADLRRVEAERLFVEGLTARNARGQTQTAITKLEEAERAWRDLRDGYMEELTSQLIGQLKAGRDSYGIRPFVADDVVTGRLNGGEVHIYSVELMEGQVLRVDLKERGVDVRIALIRAKDRQMIANSDFGFGYDRETLTAVAGEDGTYALVVGAPESGPGGSYEFTAHIKVTATDEDIERIEAGKLLADGLASRRAEGAPGLLAAAAALEKASKLWEKLGDAYWEGYTNNSLGRAYIAMGELREALDYLMRAAPLCETAGDDAGQARTLNNIGRVYDEIGERQKALDYFKRALPLYVSVGDKAGEAAALNNMGGAYSEVGELREALEYFVKALVLHREVRDKSGEAQVLNNIGRVFDDLGDKRRALEYFQQALSLLRAIVDRNREAVVLSNIGAVYSDLGDSRKALDYFEQALVLARATGDRSAEAATLNGKGAAYLNLGEPREALDYLMRAAPLYEAAGDGAGQARTLNNTGRVYDEIGERQKALVSFRQAAMMYRLAGDKGGEAQALSNMASVSEALNDRRKAIFYCKLSVNKYQELRAATRGLDSEVQKSFLRGVLGVYQKLAELLLEDGQLAQALEVLTLYQNQQFFDFSRDANVPARLVEFSTSEEHLTDLYETENAIVGGIASQIKELRRRIGNRQPDEQEAAQLEKFESALKAFLPPGQYALKAGRPRSAELPDEVVTSSASDVARMQAALQTLDTTTKRKTVILYTFVGNNRFHVLLITPDAIKDFTSQVKAADLNRLLLQFRALLQSPAYDPRLVGRQLYDIIFKPVEAELKRIGAQTLMWSLDGRLRYIPMAALWDGEQYLVERYQNVYFTRAVDEQLVGDASRKWTGAAFGNTRAQTVEMFGDKMSFPALPGVSAELSSIFGTQANPKGILNGVTFIDGTFTKETFYGALRTHRPLIHIASHFSLRPGDDARSFLLMGDGSVLTLGEMKRQERLFEGVELLVMSGGDTAATLPDSTGKEIDGFAELAQRLGAKAIMATLWQVSDASTSQLMRDFYRILENESGITKAEALRQAQLELVNGAAETKPLTEATRRGGASSPKLVVVSEEPTRTGSSGESARDDVVYVLAKDAPPFPKAADKPFAHPYYWSPFVLFGNWK